MISSGDDGIVVALGIGNKGEMADADDHGFDQADLYERQTQVEQAYQRLEKRLDTMHTNLIAGFTDIRALIDDRYLKLQGQITGLQGQFTGLDDRVGRLDERVGRIENRLDAFDQRFDRIDGNLTLLGSKLDRFIANATI